MQETTRQQRVPIQKQIGNGGIDAKRAAAMLFRTETAQESSNLDQPFYTTMKIHQASMYMNEQEPTRDKK